MVEILRIPRTTLYNQSEKKELTNPCLEKKIQLKKLFSSYTQSNFVKCVSHFYLSDRLESVLRRIGFLNHLALKGLCRYICCFSLTEAASAFCTPAILNTVCKSNS